ncbi:MAG: hypothetical protein DBX39_01895 [Bacillota bacterium]|nr:MAG: hypothetical protein DBX39_01895 [Bacillota bacterium]
MNVIFVCIFVISGVLLILRDPAAFLPAMLEGSKNALMLGVTLAAVYAVWLGFLKIAEDAGLLKGFSKVLKPLTAKFFRTKDEKALEQISVNLAANLLGMGGAATGAGVCAMRLLDERGETYARAMFFVVNCAGVQLLPATVLSLRVQSGSAAPYDIVFPALLAALAALAIGAVLVRIVYGRKK